MGHVWGIGAEPARACGGGVAVRGPRASTLAPQGPWRGQSAGAGLTLHPLPFSWMWGAGLVGHARSRPESWW